MQVGVQAFAGIAPLDITTSHPPQLWDGAAAEPLRAHPGGAGLRRAGRSRHRLANGEVSVSRKDGIFVDRSCCRDAHH